ncbi:hypothetical protein FD755_001599 [Muntiacus reevesi]|uniref:Cysteine-rich and transmembrane domain-containing protein 1 n=1 Tax=Muntiacus reevesi TaxID=9886 RepID=A0A5J5N3Z4_MUNRE|nr:hypothetical protein FD755_001599 [Muntiacus reevesi]
MNQGNPPPYPGPGPTAPYPPYPSQPMGPGVYPPGPPGGPYPPPQGGYPYQGYPQYGWQGGPQEPPKTTGTQLDSCSGSQFCFPSLACWDYFISQLVDPQVILLPLLWGLVFFANMVS